MSKLTDLTADISRLTREKNAAVQTAYKWDNELAAQHNQDLKLAAEKRVRETYDAKIQELKTEATDVAETVAAEGRRHRPAFDHTDGTAVANLSMEWTNRVQPLLQAGKSLRSILEAGNVHTALAAEQYAPTWFEANQPRIEDHAFIGRDITNRLAELASTDTAAAALRDAATVEQDLAYFNNALAAGETGDSLGAAINAAYASGDVNTSKGDKAEQGPSGSLDGAVSASYAEA